MTQEEKISELQKEVKRLQTALEAEIKTGLIKAFEMKPGHKYVIFFGRGNGISFSDIMHIKDPLFTGTLFVLNDINKVDVMDKKKVMEHFKD